MEKSFKTKLLQDISVSTDAIVSKTLLKSDSGNISLFALDAGQQISEHAAKFNVFVTVLEGIIEFTVEKEKFQLEANDALTVPAHALHGMTCLKAAKILITMFKENSHGCCC